MAPAVETALDSAFNKSLQLAFPPVLVRLIQALLGPDPSFSAISEYLRMDPMLAGKVMHSANSIHYGFDHKVSDLQQAAAVLGTGELFKLVILLTMQKRLDPIVRRESESMFGDWRLTLWSAIAAERIAARLAPEHKQNVYFAAMFKDLPLFLAFCQKEAPPFLSAEAMATLPAPQRFSEEAALWGTSHPDLAHSILLLWGMPVEVAEAVRLHHDYEGVLRHPPLTSCLIYATRWAELVHAPVADTGALIAFEVGLTSVLGLSAAEMDTFRAGCAETFNRLLTDLGIRQGKVEGRFYDQSLSLLQHYHFLALEVAGRGHAFSPTSFSLALQRHLRSFWDVSDWELFIRRAGEEKGSLIRCAKGSLFSEEKTEYSAAVPQPGWQRIDIASGGRNYGYLALPRLAEESPSFSSLPMFMHVVALHLEEQRKRASIACVDDFASIPLAIARVDSLCRIKNATRTFLELFGLAHAPTNVTARGLLDARLGISLPNWDLMTSGKTPLQGWFTLAPEGSFPGTPTYVGIYAAPDSPDDYYLVVGDVTEVSALQSIAMSDSVYLEALFSSLAEHVYLLDGSGTICWSPPNREGMTGKNIFAISRPGAAFKGGWAAGFLDRLAGVMSVQAAMITGKGSVSSFELVFTPLRVASGRQYLLVARPAVVG